MWAAHDDIEVKVDRMIDHLGRCLTERLISASDYDAALHDLGKWELTKRAARREQRL